MPPRKRRQPVAASSSSQAPSPTVPVKKSKPSLSDEEEMNFLSALVPPAPQPPYTHPTPTGYQLWKQDYQACELKWTASGQLEGYVGLPGNVHNFRQGDGDNSSRFSLAYEDIEGDQRQLDIEIVYEALETFPRKYQVLVFSDEAIPRRAQTVFSRFSLIYELDIATLVSRLLYALQGDDEADGGEVIEEEEDDLIDIDDEVDDLTLGRRFETAKGSVMDFGRNWGNLKEHFAQAKSMGYRPGLTSVSDFWVISLSIPVKNLDIEPNLLGMWDDGLVDAWKEGQRFTLLIGVETYPPHVDQLRYWLGFDKKYKPTASEITATTRGQAQGMHAFFLSTALLTLLKNFPRAQRLRTGYGIGWAAADRVAFDEEESAKVFHNGDLPSDGGKEEEDVNDPVKKGFESNLPVCAFYWILKRFVNATKYCMNCGLEVAIPSLRPYVCDKPLCLYGYMSLGLGPSVEHTLIHHSGVVDLLLTFAHSAATTEARMDLPLKLHIEVPIAFGLKTPQLIDELTPDTAREALAWLIAKLPRVSEMKTLLESGKKLHHLDCPSGSVGVLRWVIGSCRAYLKESRPGEGLLPPSDNATVDNMRQFSFVVGSPEQESNFKKEVEAAQLVNPVCKEYPSILAFHGSGLNVWHNILRTGLDFQDTTHGRAYGHGVYFASEYETSSTYANRENRVIRDNADFAVTSAIALVELVNVPSTFVSRAPFYVVANTKQIKPFMLLVCGLGETATTKKVSSYEVELFRADPGLARQTVFKGRAVRVNMPRKLRKTKFVVDKEPDDEGDARILNPPPPPKPLFEPSPADRLQQTQRMPPPPETSVVATRALSKELKTLLKTQAEGGLPFYIDPDMDSLYCWTIELHDFPDSVLKKELVQRKIRSVITEIRYPASFPHSPPFMRVLHPRCLPFAQGGGGNITAGGSICNEILTSTGWNPAFCVEAIVRDIMTNMTEATPPARLDTVLWDRPYSLYEAMTAFKRVAATHGWTVPKDFEKMAQ